MPRGCLGKTAHYALRLKNPLFLTLPTPSLSHCMLRTGTHFFFPLPIAMFQWRLLLYSPGQRGIYLRRIINRSFSYIILGDEKKVSKAYYYYYYFFNAFVHDLHEFISISRLGSLALSTHVD